MDNQEAFSAIFFQNPPAFAIANPASFSNVAVQPGLAPREIVTLFGSGIGPPPRWRGTRRVRQTRHDDCEYHDRVQRHPGAYYLCFGRSDERCCPLWNRRSDAGNRASSIRRQGTERDTRSGLERARPVHREFPGLRRSGGESGQIAQRPEQPRGQRLGRHLLCHRREPVTARRNRWFSDWRSFAFADASGFAAHRRQTGATPLRWPGARRSLGRAANQRDDPGRRSYGKRRFRLSRNWLQRQPGRCDYGYSIGALRALVQGSGTGETTTSPRMISTPANWRVKLKFSGAMHQ